MAVRLAALHAKKAHVREINLILQGFLKTALVVSSFHVLPKPHEAGGPAENTLRIYYGEGDRFGCWVDTDMRSIAWHEVKGK